MNGAFRSEVGTRLSRWRRSRQLRSSAAVALIVLGPLLAGLTFLALGPFALSAGSDALRLVLLADMIYVLVIAATVAAITST